MERPAPAIRLQECRPHAFQRWGREGVFERLLQEAGQLVEEHGEYRLYEGFPDAAFCPARGGGDGIGRTKVGKGVKILIAVDARGLPIAVQSCSARPLQFRRQCIR
ncbi:hypothetical protein [Limisphaera sp. 4302-co]|uniref:hypothetical protein n=1 Tax=Limisphaera sp. 4302-co TaxID=3400417 RepID=UPI003C1B85BE